METFLRYFWLFTGAVLIFNVLACRRRLTRAVEAGVVTRDEARRFVLIVTLSVGLLCVALQAVMWLAHYPDPSCITGFDFADWPSATFTILTVAAWTATLWWVWRGSGAVLLGRVVPVFSNGSVDEPRSYPPTLVRWAVTGLIFASAIGAGASAFMEGMRTPACEAIRSVPESAETMPVIVPPTLSGRGEYELVFDVRREGYRNWWFPAFGLIFVVVGCGMLWFRRYYPVRSGKWLRWRRAFPYIWTGFSVFWVITAFVGTYYEYRSMINALDHGRYEVVEGIVERFVPMPKEGHVNERFVVGGRRYSYSDYEVTAGFNNTSSHGGPIREGLRVRVVDVDGKIARLEIVH